MPVPIDVPDSTRTTDSTSSAEYNNDVEMGGQLVVPPTVSLLETVNNGATLQQGQQLEQVAMAGANDTCMNTFYYFSVAMVCISSVGIIFNIILAVDGRNSYATVGWAVAPCLLCIGAFGIFGRSKYKPGYCGFLLIFSLVVCQCLGLMFWFMFLFSGIYGHKIG